MYKKEKRYKEFVSDFKAKIQIKDKKILFLCIGTNKVIGDSFGPLVGSKLSKLLKDNKNVEVIGNMEEPIHNKNICNVLKFIENKRKDSFIVVIDSAISKFDIIGNIFITNGGVKLEVGSNKNFIMIGDIGIKACVEVQALNKKETIHRVCSVPEILVKDLSHIVSLGIKEVLI
jgi:putative sporulation protein YyaC